MIVSPSRYAMFHQLLGTNLGSPHEEYEPFEIVAVAGIIPRCKFVYKIAT